MNLSTSAASTLDSARKLMTSTQADIEYKLSPGTFSKVTTASLGRTTVYDMPTEGEFCPAKTLSGQTRHLAVSDCNKMSGS